MARKQVQIQYDDDPDDSSKVIITIEGFGSSYDKSYLWDGQLDPQQVKNNMRLARGISAAGHIASIDFKNSVNSWGGGLLFANGPGWIVNVSLQDEATQTYHVGYGPDANHETFGFSMTDSELDDPTPIDDAGVVMNLKSRLRKAAGVSNVWTTAQVKTYLAASAANRTFWR
jgi:hypothetical protein